MNAVRFANQIAMNLIRIARVVASGDAIVKEDIFVILALGNAFQGILASKVNKFLCKELFFASVKQYLY